MRRIPGRMLLAGVMLACWASGCSQGDPRPDHDATAGPASTEQAAPHAMPGDSTPAPNAGARDGEPVAPLDPGALAMVASVAAADWSGPGGSPFEVARRTTDPTGTHARRFGTRTMEIALRTREPDLGQFPCTSCHLGRRMALADDRVADAHRNITPTHPEQTGGVCATCHSPDDVELLTLKRGERTTLDHAYRLCAQCHIGQVEAWAGGAHGKRLDGWRGRRVLMSCTDCHDPHQPTLPPRVPFRAPQLQRTGGHDR